MKLLKKVLLINWHSFSKELIEIGNINFLTGKNAVGKSTIVDAIQLVVLGDTRGTSFNKAASEKSGRTVISYLKGEVGSDNEGNKKYLREGDFASYVALEFYDDVNNIPFVIGLQFDVSGDKLYSHQFIYDGTIPEQCFVANNKAMEYKTFKDYVSLAYKNVIFPESLTSYKEEMRKKLGQLSQRFFALFKKAVPFQPIYDIRKFITEFVCDVKYDIKSDLEKMQENVRNYTSLEVEAKTIESKIYFLERIHELYEAYNTDKNKCDQAQYLVAKLEIAKKKQEIVNINQQINAHNARFEELSQEEQSISSDLESWSKVRDQLIVDKESNDAEVKHSNYVKQKDSINKSIDSVTEVFEKSASRLVHSFNEFHDRAQQIKLQVFDKDLCQFAGVDVDLIYSTADNIIAKAEVLAKLTIAMEYTADISATTGGNTYNPVKWTLAKSTDGGSSYTNVVDAVDITLAAMESKLEAQSAYITAGQTAQVVLKLSWAWALESGADAAAIAANNKHDTAIGMFSNGADLDTVNAALGTAYTAISKSFTFSLSATITQEQTVA